MKFYSLLCRYTFCMGAFYTFPAVGATSATQGFKVNEPQVKQSGKNSIINYNFTKNGKKLDFKAFFGLLQEAFSVGNGYEKNKEDRQGFFDFLKRIPTDVDKANLWNGFHTKGAFSKGTPFEFEMKGENYTDAKKPAQCYDYMTKNEAFIVKKYGQKMVFSNQFKEAKKRCTAKFGNNNGATTVACISASGSTILVIPSQKLPTITHMKYASKEQVWSFWSMIAHMTDKYRDYIARWAIHTTPNGAQTVPRLHFRLELNNKGKNELKDYKKRLIAVQQVIKNADNTHSINTFVETKKEGEKQWKEEINEQKKQKNLVKDITWDQVLWENSEQQQNDKDKNDNNSLNDDEDNDENQTTSITSWNPAWVIILLALFGTSGAWLVHNYQKRDRKIENKKS